MGTRKEDIEAAEIASVMKKIDACEQETGPIRKVWTENHDMFVHGSRFEDKQQWQVDMSINKLQSSIRTAQGELVSILVHQPDWYYLESRSMYNQKADILAPAFKKLIDYYLEQAKFKRHAATFFLNALISIGNLYVGWKQMLVQNPEYVLERTKEERRKAQAQLAGVVANPHDATEFSSDAVLQSIQSEIDKLMGEAVGEAPQKKKLEPYIQLGCLDFQDPHHDWTYWDPNVNYMEDSRWKAAKYIVNLEDLKADARNGFYSRQKVNKIAPLPIDQGTALHNARYKNTSTRSTQASPDRVEIILYFGPRVIDGEVTEDKWFCIIANRSVILKKGYYPFWEPPGHQTPIVNTAVRQIPYRPTGAGIGDNAVKLQKVYDSNWQLVCDTFRYNIAGINIVDYQALVDKSALHEGIEPGKVIEVRGDPKKVFHREQLTMNIENQVSPVQEMLRQAIDELTGINPMQRGAPNLRSRTTAKEIDAQQQGGERTINTIALDLEQNFLVPVLQKVFARILQFGLDELQSNPDLQGLLTEEEMQELMALNAGDRIAILNQYYRFCIKGFSAQQDRQEKLMRMNEALQIINAGGPLSTLIDIPAFLKLWVKLMELDDEDILLVGETPMEAIMAETTTLLSGHYVQPRPDDDHQLHIQMQGPIAGSPYATPEMQQHAMEHQMLLEQMQAAQGMVGQDPSGNSAPPGQGTPPIQ